MTAIRHALPIKREDDFAQWYQEVISAADMAEESGVRGCMVIKPWGYGIWERMQRLLDRRIKAAGRAERLLPAVHPARQFRAARRSTSKASPRRWRSSPTTG